MLKTIHREGWKENLQINYPESVADHSYSVSVMSMILADLEGLNTEKIIKMALLHDLAESIIGDITPGSMKNDDKITKENHAMKKILVNLPSEIRKSYFKIWDEYQNLSLIHI